MQEQHCSMNKQDIFEDLWEFQVDMPQWNGAYFQMSHNHKVIICISFKMDISMSFIDIVDCFHHLNTFSVFNDITLWEGHLFDQEIHLL